MQSLKMILIQEILQRSLHSSLTIDFPKILLTEIVIGKSFSNY
jgi:hypothetical protein